MWLTSNREEGMKLSSKTLALILSSCLLSMPAYAQHASHHKIHHTFTTHTTYRPVHYQSVYNKKMLINEINQIIQSVGSNVTIGVTIKSMRTGSTLYTHNDQHFFVPASTLKVLTAEAALLYLGPEFKFHTRMMTDAPTINNGIIEGNLYLVHSGDPTLTYFDLTNLMARLKNQQVQQIRGNVYIDNSAYDQENTGPGWLWNDMKSCFAAPINASIINHNCLSFTLVPAKLAGQSAQVLMDRHYYFSGLKNSVVTTKNRSKNCGLKLSTGEGNIQVSGCLPKGRNTRGFTTVVSNLVQYNKQLLQDLFMRYDIQVHGVITSGIAPPNLLPIAIHESKPLRDIITEMLKKSDNIIAGSLLKKMGQFFSHRPGSWENGGNAILKILSQKASVDVWRMNVIDGSGLSRFNKVSPAQIMQVLDFAYHNYKTNNAFISALPVSGVDGTLKHRLQQVTGKVRAKTGTMHGILSLAGYAINADKEPYAFVIMINGSPSANWQYKEIEDKIVTYLTHYSDNA